MAEADFKPQHGYKELLLGCGRNRKKRLKPEFAKEKWQNLIIGRIRSAIIQRNSDCF